MTISTAQRLNFNETADALANGDIDAGFWSVGAPTSSILNLATTNTITVISLSADQVATAPRGRGGDGAHCRLPGGIYAGVPDDGLDDRHPERAGGVCRHGRRHWPTPITKAMFENIADLQAVHPAANETTVEFTMVATPVPLHPGAIRYYEEIGATIPDNLRP